MERYWLYGLKIRTSTIQWALWKYNTKQKKVYEEGIKKVLHTQLTVQYSKCKLAFPALAPQAWCLWVWPRGFLHCQSTNFSLMLWWAPYIFLALQGILIYTTFTIHSKDFYDYFCIFWESWSLGRMLENITYLYRYFL